MPLFLTASGHQPHGTIYAWQRSLFPLKWRHNERNDGSNHQRHDCVLNRLFRRRSKKTPKLHVTDLCEAVALLRNDVSHWLGACLESALSLYYSWTPHYLMMWIFKQMRRPIALCGDRLYRQQICNSVERFSALASDVSSLQRIILSNANSIIIIIMVLYIVPYAFRYRQLHPEIFGNSTAITREKNIYQHACQLYVVYDIDFRMV